MSTYLVYNPTRRLVHKVVDGRAFEQCNIDDIAEPRTLDQSQLQTLQAEGRVHLCHRCFPDDRSNHITLGSPKPGQGIVTEITTDPPMHETPRQRTARVTAGAPPTIDHLEPKRGDGLTPQSNPRPGGLDEIPAALVQVNMDQGPRFEGGGTAAQPHLPERVKGTPDATASADAGEPSFNAMSTARRNPDANVDLESDELPPANPPQRKVR